MKRRFESRWNAVLWAVVAATAVLLAWMLSRVGLDTEKNAFNAAAAELEGGEFTKFLDPATIPALCADGAYSSGTNFQDQVHPTTAGHAILAAAVKANMI